jgi:hypothetical protein
MVIKLIRAIFLLYAGLAIVLHTIIPHDHHLTGPVTNLKESCPISHERSVHHPVFPGHCYAFNDLAADRFSQVIVRLAIPTSYAFIIWHPGHPPAGLNLSVSIIENTGKPFPDIYLPDFSPFRAPPYLS